MIGQKINMLTILERDLNKKSTSYPYYICKCDCGNIKSIRSDSIKNGSNKSCGCLLRCKVKVGEKYGNFEIVAESNERTSRGTKLWMCKCKCGNSKLLATNWLLSGSIQSCGCARKGSRTGIKSTAWKGCGELSGNHWGRIKAEAKRRRIEVAITIEDAWKLFKKQKGKCALSGDNLTLERGNTTASLDRIDSSKGYVKDNIQWIDKELNWMKGTLGNSYFVAKCTKVAKHQESPLDKKRQECYDEEQHQRRSV